MRESRLLWLLQQGNPPASLGQFLLNVYASATFLISPSLEHHVLVTVGTRAKKVPTSASLSMINAKVMGGTGIVLPCH